MLKYLLLIVVCTAVINARNLGVPCDFDTKLCDNCPSIWRQYQYNEFGCPISCDCDFEMLFEGDIKLEGPSLALANKLYGISSDDNDDASYGLTSVLRLFWPKLSDQQTVEIPYTLDSSLNSAARRAINESISDFDSKTCIRLVERNKEKDYVNFIDDDECYSQIGRQGNQQNISIGWGCENKGTVNHEIMHALGFWHEQSRPDRDNYVTINWENIESGKAFNFKKRTASEINSLGSPYDCGSIMHYGVDYFTWNGKDTITPINTSCIIGQRDGFSKEDLRQINARYCTSCEDKRTSDNACETWEKAGLCDDIKYSTLLKENCKKTCDFCRENCTGTSCETCEDKRTEDNNCQIWKNWGYCKNDLYIDYFKMNCNKSCGYCGVCEDKKEVSTCDTLEKAGLCTDARSKAYMEAKCNKSCGFCKG